MKEDNILYVLKLNTDGQQVLQRANHQIYPSEIARGRNVFTKYEPYTREVGCQYEVIKHNFCTCKKEVMLRRPEFDYFGFPKQIYACHGPRNNDIGVGSVKALIRKRVKIYLPETDDRGVGSSDLTSFIMQKSRQPDPDSFYDHKRTSSKCVGGLEVPNTGCVLSKKLSPIIYTKSDGTNPIMMNNNKNQEIGSNTVMAVTTTHTAQAQHIDKKSIIGTKSKDKKSVKSFDSSKKKSKLLANSKPVDSNKDTDRDFSSDSLVQHIHNLEDLSEIRPSRLSMDVMENKIETEYRHIFSTKSKEDKPKKDKSGGSDIKSASVLKRRFEALRRGLSKKEDVKRISIGGSKESSQVSRPSHKDVSIASDPPSLEARSFSSTGVYTPVPPSSRVNDKKGYNRRAIQKASVASVKDKNTLQWEDVDEDDSEIQGVQGMFELWGQKFDLEDAQKNIQIPSPPDSISKKPFREPKQDSPTLEEKKEGRKFFFFKKKAKDKAKPYKNKKNVTAGRCELRDGLMIKIATSQEKKVSKDIHRDVTPENYNKILRKAWFRKYLTKAIESKNSVKIRWNNKTYATSSSTVFELMDNVYKEAGVLLKSRSETTVTDSNYYDTYNRNHNVNFAHQDIEAWMIPTLTNNPKELPFKIRIRPSTELRDKIKIRISDDRRSMDESKAFSHQFEVILRSQNFIKLDEKESSEYVTIDIPVGFFISSSSENYKHKLSSEEVVYNIVGYETGSEQDRVGNLEYLKANNSDVKASNKVSAEMVKKRLISPPECRDVIIQGSQVFTLKICDIVGVATDTPRGIRNTKRTGIKIQDELLLFGDGSNKVFTSNNKKIEFAENYLQDYYKNSTPLGFELFSWCVSDSHLNCRLKNSNSSNNNQGDVTRSCSDILDSFHPITNMPSCHTPPCSQFVAFVDDDKTVEKGFNSNRKRTELSGPRMSPKDSIQVCKKRMFYAVSNKSKWNDYDVADSDQCNVNARKMANPCVTFAEKSLRQNKICDKHILMPNCESIREAHEKQLEDVPGILVFKGKSSKCNTGAHLPNQGQKPDTGHNSKENRSPCYSPRQSCSPPRHASPPKMPCCTPPKGSGSSPKISKPLLIFLPPQNVSPPPPPSPPRLRSSPLRYSAPKGKCPQMTESPSPSPPPKRTCSPPPCPPLKGKSLPWPCSPPPSPPQKKTCSPPPSPPPKRTCSPRPCSPPASPPPKRTCLPRPCSPPPSPPPKRTCSSPPCSPPRSPPPKRTCSPPPCPALKGKCPPRPCSPPPSPPPKRTCSPPPCGPRKGKSPQRRCSPPPSTPPKKTCSPRPCSPPKTKCPAKLCSPPATTPPKRTCPSQPCPLPKGATSPPARPPPKGIHIEVIPNMKKNCCKNNVPESAPDENCCIRLNSKEKLTIRMRTQSASTEEIREGFNIKVQDDDGKTLYERRDYSKPENPCTPVSHGNVYNSSMNIHNVHRIPTKVLSESSKFKKSFGNEIMNQDKSETNVANLIEVQFQMRVSQGDEATEISIENDAPPNEKVENNDIYNMNIPNGGYIVKNEPNVCIENKDPKNDINIRILIKTFKSKDKKDISTDEYSRKISEKFRTVSTGYSNNLCNKIDDKMFSVHRTTVDLTTPDKSKTHMTHGKRFEITHSGIRSISTVQSTGKPSRGHSEIIISDLPLNHEGTSDVDQNKKYIYDSSHSIQPQNIDNQQESFSNSFPNRVTEKGYISDKDDITEKTDFTEKTDYTDKDDYALKDDLTEKDDLTTERDEFTEREDYTEKDDLTDNYLTEDSDARHLKDHGWTMKDLEKVYHNVRKNKSFEQNYKALISTDTDDQDLVLEANTSNEQDATLSIGVAIKPHTKHEKIEMLKDIFEKTHDMEGNKAQMKQLKNILTSDSSEHENLHIKSNELAKDVTFASLKPNYSKGSDSMTNYYNVDGDSVSLKDSKIRPDCSVYSKGSYLSSDNDGRRKECMCKTLATRLEPTKLIRGGGCCCCSKPICLKDEEVACDIKSSDSCNLSSKPEGNFVDVEIQHSKLKAHTSTDISVHSYNRSKLNIIETCNVVQYEEITANVIKTEIQRTRNRQSSKKNRIIQSSSMKVMHNNILKISDRTVMSAVNPSGDEIDGETSLLRASDILQSYEAKKAVLEIYAEKSVCKDSEHLIAKLPKFVYGRESEIEMNYEAIASNSYKSTYKNSGVKSINR